MQQSTYALTMTHETWQAQLLAAKSIPSHRSPEHHSKVTLGHNSRSNVLYPGI